MSAPTDKAAVVRAWVDKAEEDYKAAKVLLDSGHDCPNAIVCFHVQQCVEKYAKAILSGKGIDFGKTHDMATLRELLPPDTVLPITEREEDELTGYAVSARYPRGDDPITREEAVHAVQLLEKVRSAARKSLSLT